jgi:hypothetical protein
MYRYVFDILLSWGPISLTASHPATNAVPRPHTPLDIPTSNTHLTPRCNHAGPSRAFESAASSIQKLHVCARSPKKRYNDR